MKGALEDFGVWILTMRESSPELFECKRKAENSLNAWSRREGGGAHVAWERGRPESRSTVGGRMWL